MVLDLENKCKIFHEKNKTMYTEVLSLRKELSSKEDELEKTQMKASQLEKRLVLSQRQSQ